MLSFHGALYFNVSSTTQILPKKQAIGQQPVTCQKKLDFPCVCHTKKYVTDSYT